MLVLSRKRGESVVVGGAVGFERILEVTVLEIQGANVKLGFQIDAGVPVHRREVWQRLQGIDHRESLPDAPAGQHP